MRIEWVARNGNIMQPRFYRLHRSVPTGFGVEREHRRTYIQLGRWVFTTEPKEGT